MTDIMRMFTFMLNVKYNMHELFIWPSQLYCVDNYIQAEAHLMVHAHYNSLSTWTAFSY